MKISVTQEDIDNGKRKECDSCPVALAIMRHFKAKSVWVDVHGIYYYHNDVNDCGKEPMTKEILEFIIDFDAGRNVKPFDIIL